MTMTVTASYSEPRETMRTMSGDVTTITGVDVTVEYEYGATTAALAALDRAAEPPSMSGHSSSPRPRP